MAIPFLNNIDLDNNQLLNAKLQVTSGTPAAAQGQIYFNSASGFNKVRYHDGSDWKNVLDTTSLINGTFVKATTTNDVNVTLDLSATGTKDATTYLRGDNTWAVVDSYSGWKLSAGSGTPVNIDGGDTVNFTGTGTTTVTRSAKTITINSADEYEGTVKSVSATHAGNAFTAAIGGTAVDPSVDITMNGNATEYIDGAGDLTTFPTLPTSFNINLIGDVTGTGATGADITTTISSGAVDFAMINPAVIITDAEGIENNDNDTTIPTSAAVKAYADQASSNALIYQGSYNAATNSPNLDNSPSPNLIKTGWTYTVTADGLFFTEQVRVGDVLIAEIYSPTALADWTTVQNNIDLANFTTIGIGNVNIEGAGNKDGLSLSYSSGTATLGLDINSLTANDATDDPTSNYSIPFYSDPDGENYKITIAEILDLAPSANSWSGTIGNGSLTSLPIVNGTHGLGTDSTSFMIQLVEVSSGETVYADVTRGASGLVTIDFASPPATNAIRVLIQKIG